MAKFTLILSLVLIFFNSAVAGVNILNRKIISEKRFSCKDISSVNLFIDDNNNIFIQVGVSRMYRHDDYLYMNNKWEVLNEYGVFLNGFLKNGHLYLAFRKDETIDIYKIQEDIKLSNHIKIEGIPRRTSLHDNSIIPIPGRDSSYYLLSRFSKFPAHPIELLNTIMAFGHGVYYEKPVLAEIHDNKMLQYQKFKYGGKADESFITEEVTSGKESIHLLGFRGPEDPKTTGQPIFASNQPVILHYACYNPKKKKTTRKHSIYENIPGLDRSKDTRFRYGTLSMDNLEDDIFVVFPWIEASDYSKPGYNINDIKSNIYYWQYCNNSSRDIEKIGIGFFPLVRVDFLGDVHVIWLSGDGGLVHKTKKDDKWSDEEIVLKGINMIYPATYRRHIAAEFDKNNNLHVVYPSGGNLVHAIAKVN